MIEDTPEKPLTKTQQIKAWAAKNANPLTPMTGPGIKPNGYLARGTTMEPHPKYPPTHRKDYAGQIKPTDAVKVIARRYTEMAFARLANIAENSPNHVAVVNAIKEILNRGWGTCHPMAESETKPGTNIQVVFGERPKVTVIENDTTATIEDDDDDTADE